MSYRGTGPPPLPPRSPRPPESVHNSSPARLPAAYKSYYPPPPGPPPSHGDALLAPHEEARPPLPPRPSSSLNAQLSPPLPPRPRSQVWSSPSPSSHTSYDRHEPPPRPPKESHSPTISPLLTARTNHSGSSHLSTPSILTPDLTPEPQPAPDPREQYELPALSAGSTLPQQGASASQPQELISSSTSKPPARTDDIYQLSATLTDLSFQVYHRDDIPEPKAVEALDAPESPEGQHGASVDSPPEGKVLASPVAGASPLAPEASTIPPQEPLPAQSLSSTRNIESTKKTTEDGSEPMAMVAGPEDGPENSDQNAYCPPTIEADLDTSNESACLHSGLPPTQVLEAEGPEGSIISLQTIPDNKSEETGTPGNPVDGSMKHPPPFKTCLESTSVVHGTYYWHPGAPEFLICSRCYVDHIEKSIFAPTMESEFLDDGEPRICRFSKPRMKDHLYPEALATGSLRGAVEWMRKRATILDCQGTNGVSGGQGVKWYKAQQNQIPGFVVCEACFEDHMAFQPPSSHLAAIPEDLPKSEGTWACDLAIPYILRLWEKLAKDLTWDQFVSETKGRMAFHPCPGQKATSTYKKLWFVPKTGHQGLIACAACWADHVLLTGDDDKWRHGVELMEQTGNSVCCSFSNLIIRMPMLKSHDEKNYSIFWSAIDELSKTPPCDAKGIKGGKWWTLPSNPEEFQVCAACYTGLAGPLGLDHLLVPKTAVGPNDTLLCTFNPKSPRVATMLQKFFEMCYNHDTTSLERYAKVWARMPPCQRDKDYANGRWYGWLDCTICRECYHEFASKYPSMVAAMDFKDKLLPNSAMCEMYSPRTRTLFANTASESSPPNIRPLLEFSLRRRSVYLETVPQIRAILLQSQMSVYQQQSLNAQSSFYHSMGMTRDFLLGSGYTYGAAGIGYGFANRELLKAEQLRQQAMGIVGSHSSMTMQVGMLEQKWRAVE